MEITTDRGNIYSYLPISNEIIHGYMQEKGFEWRFNPLKSFNGLSNVRMFIVGVTDKCNLRCRYCCYSGRYPGKRSHGNRIISFEDIEEIVKFIESIAGTNPIRIAFYGGEPLLNLNIIQYCVEICHQKWGQSASFSVSTNGTLLKPEVIEWLIANDVEIAISIDGSKFFHDRNRIYPNGRGSFDEIKESIKYIYNHYQDPNISFHVTLANVRDLISIAESWHEDDVLCKISPTLVHGLSPNFASGVDKIDYDDVRHFYSDLIGVYERHPEWMVLKVFLEEAVSLWSERLVFEIDSPIDMSTCLPINTKLYTDSNMDIAVCEKFSDDFRIGNVRSGIDWTKANGIVRKYYEDKQERCCQCPIVRMCNLCLTAVEYSPEQMKILCHNEYIYARVSLYAFCEMAERGLIV